MTEEWIKESFKQSGDDKPEYYSGIQILLKLQSFIVEEFKDDEHHVHGNHYYAKDLLNKLTQHFFKEDEIDNKTQD